MPSPEGFEGFPGLCIIFNLFILDFIRIHSSLMIN